ncbi:sodium channel protein Nach-like isoform X2 [Aphis gossypii]|uniref:sodium channel protein Nach-like isoform X2 n=1 Tax=Aphis gossypii TaxID=80765 RepID=UPI0021592997|nr:sodium channel protein Nach-like isoform X2 [Aphis gossypii]
MLANDGFQRWNTVRRNFLPRMSPAAVQLSVGRVTTVAKSSCALIDEYTSHSTVHGMRYISKASLLEKVFWITMLTICGLSACYIGNDLWLKFRSMPTQLAVKDTHVPLYEFPFPSITICPAIKVKKTKAFEYFSKYISIDNDTIKTELMYVMSALSTMQQPTYFRMAEYVEKSKHLLPLFRDINLTDFMLTTLPTCNELFGRCHWHGEVISCCEAFSLQRTEEGFCYSFNSLTSEAGKHCPLSEVLENEGIVEEDDYMYPGCQLRRNTAVGTVTGLEVFLYKTNMSESLGLGQRDKDGARVMIHTSYQFPNAGDGIWLRSEEGRRLNIMISPVITVTSSRVKDLSVATRGCVFPDERELYIYHVYTQSSCLIQCRMEFILFTCGCHMYFFVTPGHIRMLTPPKGTPGFESRLIRDSLDCSQCIPTCYETTHEIEMESSPDQRTSVWKLFSYLDVAYGNLGSKKYQRDITFAWTDLLVALGGVANLFLGFSILSVAELIYWMVKICVNKFIRLYK